MFRHLHSATLSERGIELEEGDGDNIEPRKIPDSDDNGKQTNINMSLETKVKGSVKSENIFKESVKKEELTRVNWALNWSWCVDLFREREKEIAEYKKKKAIEKGSKEFFDERTVRPFPETCSRDIGWLSSKKEFQLEIFGSYYENPKLSQNAPDASSSIFYYSRGS